MLECEKPYAIEALFVPDVAQWSDDTAKITQKVRIKFPDELLDFFSMEN